MEHGKLSVLLVNHNNGMRDPDTVVLPYYQTDDNLYAVIYFFFLSENSEYNKKEDLDKGIELNPGLIFGGGIYYESCNQENIVGNIRDSARNLW